MDESPSEGVRSSHRRQLLPSTDKRASQQGRRRISAPDPSGVSARSTARAGYDALH
ncbi:hypothetical protein ACFOX2_11505 [Corynebacterium marambiense]|uniref:hypothetical protein n=1 Tax=Corynebacterium marambiense TaxID=2765364 RepID=UPI003614649F